MTFQLQFTEMMAVSSTRYWIERNCERRSLVVRFVSPRAKPSDFSTALTWTRLVTSYGTTFPDPDDIVAVPHRIPSRLPSANTDLRFVWATTQECRQAVKALKMSDFKKINVASVKYVDSSKVRSILLHSNLYSLLKQAEDGKKVEEAVPENRTLDSHEPKPIDYHQELIERSNFNRALTPESSRGVTPPFQISPSHTHQEGLSDHVPHGGLPAPAQSAPAVVTPPMNDSTLVGDELKGTEVTRNSDADLETDTNGASETKCPEWVMDLKDLKDLPGMINTLGTKISCFFGNSQKGTDRMSAMKNLGGMKSELADMKKFSDFMEENVSGEELSIEEKYIFYKYF